MNNKNNMAVKTQSLHSNENWRIKFDVVNSVVVVEPTRDSVLYADPSLVIVSSR